MKNPHRGFAHPIVFLVIIAVIGVSFFVIKLNEQKNPFPDVLSSQPRIEDSKYAKSYSIYLPKGWIAERAMIGRYESNMYFNGKDRDEGGIIIIPAIPTEQERNTEITKLVKAVAHAKMQEFSQRPNETQSVLSEKPLVINGQAAYQFESILEYRTGETRRMRGTFVATQASGYFIMEIALEQHWLSLDPLAQKSVSTFKIQ